MQPFTSEVTLVIDRDLAIPVQNTRTGARSVAFGDANAHGGGLELRFMQANSDVQEGDVLTTSGVDGVYPAGPAGRRRSTASSAAPIRPSRASTACRWPRVTAARYVLVLAPRPAPPSRRRPAPADRAAATPPGEKADKADKADAKADKPSRRDAKAATRPTSRRPTREGAAR